MNDGTSLGVVLADSAPMFSLMSKSAAVATGCIVWLTPVYAANTMQRLVVCQIGLGIK